jgi:hypothetical protein
MAKMTAHKRYILKAKKPEEALFLDPELSIVVKIFEFYLVTQSLLKGTVLIARVTIEWIVNH